MTSRVCTDFIHLIPAQKMMIKERSYNQCIPGVEMKTRWNLTFVWRVFWNSLSSSLFLLSSFFLSSKNCKSKSLASISHASKRNRNTICPLMYCFYNARCHVCLSWLAQPQSINQTNSTWNGNLKQFELGEDVSCQVLVPDTDSDTLT